MSDSIWETITCCKSTKSLCCVLWVAGRREGRLYINIDKEEMGTGCLSLGELNFIETYD